MLMYVKYTALGLPCIHLYRTKAKSLNRCVSYLVNFLNKEFYFISVQTTQAAQRALALAFGFRPLTFRANRNVVSQGRRPLGGLSGLNVINPLALAEWVELFYRFMQFLFLNMRVNLRCDDAFVAKQFLHNA